MPILLLLVIPTVLTLGLSPFVKRLLPLQRLAGIIAFIVAAGLTALYTLSEWRDSYGGWKLVEAGSAVLLNSSLVALFHWAIWSLALRLWRRCRREPQATIPSHRP